MKQTMPPKEYVKLTQEVLSSKTDIFETFPTCIENIIKMKMWEELTDKDGNQFKSFEAFCSHPLWHGLELTIDELLGYLKKAPDVKALVLGELEGLKEQTDNEAGPGRGKIKQGSNATMFNEQERPKQSRGTSYIAKRLKRDAPELFSKVQSGELTAHAAAIVAGFKKPMVQVRTDNANAAITKLLNHYTADELKKEIMEF